jgi:AmiR/NasT family two-component response regulator
VPGKDDRIEQLQVAVEHRTAIGIALGMLMERHRISQEGAFDLLRSRSQRENRKVYDIAVEMAHAQA